MTDLRETCEVCGFTCTPSAMGMHRRKHQADQLPRKACDICGREFWNPGALGRHRQAHGLSEEFFWAQVVQDDETGCWEWQATRAPKGDYGRFTDVGRSILAHRYAYELLEGPVPEGLQLDHLCINPGCVNPGHLEPVTHAENMRRAFEHQKRVGAPCSECGFVAAGPAALTAHIRAKHPEAYKPLTRRINGKVVAAVSVPSNTSEPSDRSIRSEWGEG